MGYTKFSSLSYILDYNYTTSGEINEALSSLKAMYSAGNISEYQYRNAVKLLEDKLRDL